MEHKANGVFATSNLKVNHAVYFELKLGTETDANQFGNTVSFYQDHLGLAT